MPDKEIAENATPGPWQTDDSRGVWNEVDDIYVFVHAGPTSENGCDWEMSDENRRFIAHFNPAKVLELLNEIDVLRNDIGSALRLFPYNDNPKKMRKLVAKHFNCTELHAEEILKGDREW